MFDCCILVPNEMNGGNLRDFPIAPHLKIGRDENGLWNYTQISELLNKVAVRVSGPLASLGVRCALERREGE